MRLVRANDQVNVKIPKTEKQALERAARARNMTTSELVRECIRKAIQDQPDAA
jgi:predicted DNA-binding protein